MECHTLPVDLKPQAWSDEGMNRLDQLATLLRFPSISAQKEHARDVSDCADWLVDKLSGMGLEAKACKTPLHPIVLARSPREEGKPTVLIYGHYDVQPVDPVELWESDPFEPEVRDGKIYARGATDNKGQLFAHILGVEELLRQNGGHLPVNVIFLLEGEEEVGSGSLSQFIKEHREELACDVIVVSDTGMAAPDTPTFSYGLRGLAGAEIIVKGPSAYLHSGVFGGAVANPIAALAEIIASFHDEEGRVAVRGFYDGVEPIATWERSMWATVPGMSNEELAQLTGVETVVTEAGFGADLGAEKFLDIKCRYAGLAPSAIVVVATLRALKYNGGVPKADTAKPNVEAVKAGLCNLAAHVENMKKYGVPVVVAINHFLTDSDEEVEVLENYCRENDVEFALSDVFAKGGEGGIELAHKVVKACEKPANFAPIYDVDLPIKEKIETIAKTIYGADGVTYSSEANKAIAEIEKLGKDKLPICMAKTQYSLSDDATKLGRPTGFKINIRDVKLSAVAGFIVALSGAIMTMPGLGKEPAAYRIDIDADGNIHGLF